MHMQTHARNVRQGSICKPGHQRFNIAILQYHQQFNARNSLQHHVHLEMTVENLKQTRSPSTEDQ